LSEEAFPRAFVGGPVGDCHGVYNLIFSRMRIIPLA